MRAVCASQRYVLETRMVAFNMADFSGSVTKGSNKDEQMGFIIISLAYALSIALVRDLLPIWSF